MKDGVTTRDRKSKPFEPRRNAHGKVVKIVPETHEAIAETSLARAITAVYSVGHDR